MKRTSLFLCSLLVIISARAESPKPSHTSSPATLSLDAITESVLANNPALKEGRARWQALKQQAPQAAAWDDVKVSGSTRLARFVDVPANSFTDQMFSVEQAIPISGKNRSRERIAAAEAITAMEDLRRKELDVIAKARSAYFALIRDNSLLEINRANAASMEQTVEISRAKLEAGNQGQADVLAAENELIRLTEARHDLERNISQDETQLKVLMNRDPFSLLGKPQPQPQPGHEHFAIEPLRAAMLNRRPEVRSAEASVAMAKARLELAHREWIPDPTISVETQRYNRASQAVSEVGAGVSFTLPWFNETKYHAHEVEAARGVEAAQQTLAGARTEALGLLRDQLQKIETMHHHVDLFETRLIPNARQIVETNRANYENGKTGFLELVTSERSLRETEAMYQQHLADCQIAVAELEALIGADLHLCSPHQEPTKRRSR